MWERAKVSCESTPSAKVAPGATYPPRSVVQRPYALVDVNFVAKVVGKGRPRGNGRGHGGLEEVHQARAGRKLWARLVMSVSSVRG